MSNTNLNLSQKLWGPTGSLLLLLVAAAIVVLIMLPSNELWTMESRWAAVTLQMILRNDYLHPFLYNGPYFDKPLLSYWLILGCAKLIGGLNETALRLPSALAAITTVYCIYKIGCLLVSRNAGLIAGWLLITLFYFDFWGRTASADMLNVAGIMLATWWYIKNKNNLNFITYAIFFIIIALTCLCKGLIGALPLLIIAPDLLLNREWKKHPLSLLLAAASVGVIVYLIPFWLSATWNTPQPQTSGLAEVFKENFQRFTAPFDHTEPFYFYLMYLPLYLLPWTILFIPALGHNVWKWRNLSLSQRWLVKIIILILLLFSLSGSKRGYYILPIIPFAALLVASWLDSYLFLRFASWSETLQKIICVIYVLLTCWFGIAQPLLNDQSTGIWAFAAQVHQAAKTKKPWNQWEVTILKTAADNSAIFYLKPKHEVKPVTPNAIDRTKIIITTKENLLKLQPILNNYQLVNSDNTTVALVPK